MESPLVAQDDHALLDLGIARLQWSQPLAGSKSPPWLTAMLATGAPAPLCSDDRVRAAVRDLLRHGGFKPTGRSKPSSEYLVVAAREGRLAAINPAVDLGNAVSLHSGLPISVVDLDRVQPPMRVGLAEADARFVFNAAGQEIDVGRLLCLHDAQGPCANAVKDAQRSKTGGATLRTLVLIWGTKALPGRTERTVAWLDELAARLGATAVGAAAP